MAVVIRGDNNIVLSKLVLYLIIIVLIVVIVWALWYYVISKYLRGEIFAPGKVTCTTAPGVPTGLAVTLNSNRAYVSWTTTAKTDNYILYMGRIPNFPLVSAERTITVRGNSVVVLNLIPVTYYFKVAAANSCGTSSPSTEIALVVTDWPSKFKLCKTDDPRICLSMDTANEAAFTSEVCANGICDLTYASEQNIKRADADLCLFQTDIPGPDIETGLVANTCTLPTVWTINLSTGRVTSPAGLCMGGESIAGVQVFNTDCGLIFNPDDPRYSWTPQAVTF
jgi:hypothetical protein